MQGIKGYSVWLVYSLVHHNLVNKQYLEVSNMSFIAKSPLDKDNEVQMPMGRQIQGGPTVDMGSPMTDLATDAGLAMAGPASTALLGAAPVASAAAGTTAAAGTGLLGALAGTGAAGAAAAPLLAAAGPFALMALPFLLKDGTPGVPDMDYGPDPLQGYMNGTNRVQGYKNGIPGVPGLAGMAMDKFGIKSPMSVVGKALGFNDGTNMAYAGGTDSVPAMLTPGEAVIPAAAAQNPQNKPMINSMINEGRQANDMVEGGQIDMTVMSGPLSGKAQREQMQVLQNMSLKKKAAEADEARKQKAFEQKYAHNDMKAMLSMRQS
ncbi:hypothetical protein N9Z55_10850 [Akkermansiaceae bacterium]|nr:hypothetical protein [Akkermansiaceae bacterium]